MGLFNGPDPLRLDPPSLDVLDQSFVCILPPEGRNQVVFLQEIVGLVHQSQIAAQLPIEAFPTPMVSIQDLYMGLHIMKARQIICGLQERRMRVIKSQLHT